MRRDQANPQHQGLVDQGFPEHSCTVLFGIGLQGKALAHHLRLPALTAAILVGHEVMGELILRMPNVVGTWVQPYEP